ncbi:hypothetical protein MMC24_000052 [Lignoscripta atroalba]|nr:hypothetical protein [Lignoscripta atroalba]
MTDPQPTNIKTLFTTAKGLRKQLGSWGTTSETYQENLQSAIATFEECRRLADQVSLFSPNETEDDISSGDLQYLSIDYFLGELVLKDTKSDRKVLLRRAQEAYDRYLGRLDLYNILSKPDKKLYDQYLENRDAFALLPSKDATARRDTKISRFKQETELKRELEHLSQNPSALQTDDAALRSLYLSELQLHTHHAFHSLDLIAQELKILALAPPSPPPDPETLSRDYRERTGRNTNTKASSDRLDGPISQQLLANGKAGPLLSKDGKPLKPFVLLDSRQRLREGVFRPDHSLPTMTIDEYLAEEKRRGGMVEGGGEQSGVRQEVDEDDLERADVETEKAREWDEFKEDNPKGSGNTLNRG